MFDNIGGKIKTMVWRSFQVKCAVSVVIGVALLFSIPPFGLLLGPLAAAVLIALAYQSSFKLYALGQLVENSNILAGRFQPEVPQEPASKKVKVVCGACHCEYFAEPNDREPCPNCGSTFRIYPRDDT